MNAIPSNGSVETILNDIMGEVTLQSGEEKKITSSQIKMRKQKLSDQREARIENLKEQAKEISTGKCFKFIKVIFKSVDLLAKPLSLITGNKLKLNFAKLLDNLAEAKKQGHLLGLKIDGEQITKFIDDIKKHLGMDLDSVKDLEAHDEKETQRIMQILDEIDQTFKATQMPTKGGY